MCIFLFPSFLPKNCYNSDRRPQCLDKHIVLFFVSGVLFLASRPKNSHVTKFCMSLHVCIDEIHVYTTVSCTVSSTH